MSISCNCCFEDYVVKCPETIDIFAKLEPTSEYKWVITDKFNRQYSGDFTTDVNGFWQIPVAELPDGLLTEFSGHFKIQVFAEGNCAPVKFLIAQQSDCIVFDVNAGTREKSNIGCEF